MDDIEQFTASLPEKPEKKIILAFLESSFSRLSGDEGYLEMIQTGVPGMEASYGIRVPQMRALIKGLVKKYKNQLEELRSLIKPIWDQPSREHKLAALFIAFYSKIPAGEGWDIAQRLIPDIKNWEVCDQLCLSLTTPALAQNPDLFDMVEDWAESENFWRRRVALVTAAILRKPEFPDTQAGALDERALQICLNMLDDPEPYIAKAVDWTIREVLKRRYEMGQAWVFARLEEPLSRTARSTLRKASAKLNESDRAVFIDQLSQMK